MAVFERVPVNTSLLPVETTAALPFDITTDDFRARIKDGGTLELISTTWEIGAGPSYERNESAFVALDELILKDSKIITNGNTLTIIANRVKSLGGSIVAFEGEDETANDGENGETAGEAGDPGLPGDSGGVVSIHIIESFEGTLDVKLDGQRGGNGGNGQKGTTGSRGRKGADSVSAIYGCQRGGQNGGRGGVGGSGGNGGDAGSGGQGGSFLIYTIGDEPLGDASFRFKADGGKPGSAGKGGQGGDGGKGGKGGRGSTFCSGGKPGPKGERGPAGEDGREGLKAGDGQLVNKAINLEVTIRQGVRDSGARLF